MRTHPAAFRYLGRTRAAMAALLVATALVFAIGIFFERGTGAAAGPHVEATSPPAAQSTAAHVESSGEAGELAQQSPPAAEGPAASGEVSEPAGIHTEAVPSESILGIDTEAPALVALAIILSLLAAYLVWRDGRRIVIAGAVVLAVGFAALDVLEVIHQTREGTVLVAVIAAAPVLPTRGEGLGCRTCALEFAGTRRGGGHYLSARSRAPRDIKMTQNARSVGARRLGLAVTIHSWCRALSGDNAR